MFGYTFVKKERLERLEKYEAEHLKITQLYRYFAGWRDLDIIWEYLIKDHYHGGILHCRRKYARARGTNEYGGEK